MKKLLILFIAIFASHSMAITFSEFATDNNLSHTATTIDAHDSNIDSLAGLANAYDLLINLNLHSNALEIIHSDDFGGLYNLEYLFLRSNSISSIEPGSFQPLINLKILELQYNDLTSTTVNDFTGLDNLEKLDLSTNDISNIEANSFAHLIILQELDLKDNKLSFIDSGDFEGLDKLVSLNLNSNIITSIESGDFSGLGNLQSLSLNSNLIRSIEYGDFTGVENLLSLDLGWNAIESIDSNNFNDLDQLETLSLSNNAISNIAPGSFSSLGNLESLNLRYNVNLRNLNFDDADFSSLTTFRLRFCPIENVSMQRTKLNQTAFDTLMAGGYYYGIAEIKGVINLNMSNTDFSGINLTAMYTLDDLQRLNISNTSGIGDDTIANLTSELSSLNVLDIRGLDFANFSIQSKEILNSWDTTPGNILITDDMIDFNLSDFAKFARCWMTSYGENNFDNKWDFIDDGIIDMQDLSEFALQWLYWNYIS